MLNLQLARKYAMAVFEIAQDEDKLVAYGEELRLVSQVTSSHMELRGFLANPQIQPKAKKELLTKLFQDELSKTVFNFLMLLVDKRREVLIEAIEHEYAMLSNKARGIVLADVTSALPMTDSQSARLQAKLAEITEKSIQLRLHVDEKILGGVIVKMGDKRIDGSVVGRMQSLKEQLLANK